jgi:FKBP-type peptidyl-prolyl cis-trans isomerase FkpA
MNYNKMKWNTLLLFFVFATLFVACTDKGFQTRDDGLRFKYLKRGQGLVLPQIGEYVFCHYTIKNQDDSIIFSTYHDLKREDRIPLQAPRHKGGDIFSALAMMSEGDSMAFLIVADSFFLKTRLETSLPPGVEKGSDLKVTIKLEAILNETDYQAYVNQEKYRRWVDEVTMVDSFYSKNGWESKVLENGLRYVITQESNGVKVQNGKEVNFHFIGKVLQTGAEFTNSYLAGKPAQFIAGDPAIRPEIMNQIVLLMKEGEKAVFTVPFDHAYGEEGLGNLVPPFATIVYEINLLSVK